MSFALRIAPGWYARRLYQSKTAASAAAPHYRASHAYLEGGYYWNANLPVEVVEVPDRLAVEILWGAHLHPNSRVVQPYPPPSR